MQSLMFELVDGLARVSACTAMTAPDATPSADNGIAASTYAKAPFAQATTLQFC